MKGHFAPDHQIADWIATSVGDCAPRDVVPVSVDGRLLIMALQLDQIEHERRLNESLGAVQSRGLLSALWALPEQVAWPLSGLDSLDVDTLTQEGDGFVTFEGGSVTRIYRPAGQVRATAVVAKRLVDAVATASQLPPIFRRYALSLSCARSDSDATAMAHAVGVGSAFTSSDGLSILTSAQDPCVGVPGIYRWWLAEVAYRQWLQTNAH
jgi:hypothetical protein